MQLNKRFSIPYKSLQELITIREILRALGYEIYCSFDFPVAEYKDNGNFPFAYVIYDGVDLSRGLAKVNDGLNFDNLQQCLDAHFPTDKNALRISKIRGEIEKLEEELKGLEGK